MYISGVPGAGKTSVTKNVINSLKNELDFEFVYINANLPNPMNVFKALYFKIVGFNPRSN